MSGSGACGGDAAGPVDAAMGPCPTEGCAHGWLDHRRSPPGSGFLLLVDDPAATVESVACWVCERACFPSAEAMYQGWPPVSLEHLEEAAAALAASEASPRPPPPPSSPDSCPICETEDPFHDVSACARAEFCAMRCRDCLRVD
ncbi:MAG: hypothetical protein KGI98_16415 [Euryarchaeota archaeon]|nr:hypothetical protein [Euryarchaeota archaeon]